jgi:protein-disulfide isomerase
MGTASSVDEQQDDAATVDRSEAAQRAKRDRRRGRIAVWAALGLVLLLAGGLVGFGYWATHHKPAYQVPQHLTAQRDGIIAGGTGPVRVDVYVDYACVECKAFEASAGATLDKLVAANRITLVYHPLALARPPVPPPPAPKITTHKTTTHKSTTRKSTTKGHKSTTHKAATHRATAKAKPTAPAPQAVIPATANTPYAMRAAASVGCASNLGDFLAYSNLLFDDQPKTTAGLTDNQLVQVGGQAGMINPMFAQCLRAGTYDKWITSENVAAAAKGITTAPTVLVNGASVAAAGAVPTLAELMAAIG